jgi:glycine/D-amino acid oxidase-like deaminating enzyme
VFLISSLAAEGGTAFMARKPASAKTLKSKSSSEKAPVLRASVSMRGLSIWCATAAPFASPALEQNARADVCVVGAGIAGLTTAYLLAREGKSVVVLEKDKIGGGETSHTSALLSNVMDAGYRKIESLHGKTGARLAAQSHSSAITRIDYTVAREAILCNFERLDGYMFRSPATSEKVLHEEFEAARRAGVVVKELSGPPSDLKLGPCLQFRRQAQFHPLKYMAGLAAAVKRYGGRLYTGTEVAEIKGGKSAEIKTANNKKISAAAVVIATNVPVNSGVNVRAKLAAYRSYVIGIPIPTDSVPKALYWDTEDPIHYVRRVLVKHGRSERHVLVVGGEDHKVGQSEDIEKRFARLRAWSRTHFGTQAEPEFHWSGQTMNTLDGLALIGRNPGDEDNVYIATGDSGMGLTHGTIAGILLTDLILGRHNPWTSLYDPSRKSLLASQTSE